MEQQTDLLLTCRDLYSQGAYILCERSASILLSSLLSTGINFNPAKENNTQLNPVLFSEIYLLLYSCQVAQGKYLAAAKSLDTAEKLLISVFGRNSPALLPILINLAQLHLKIIIEPNTSVLAPPNTIGNNTIPIDPVIDDGCTNIDQEILIITKSIKRARNILEKIQQTQTQNSLKNSFRVSTNSMANPDLINETILEYTGHILHLEGMISYIQNKNPAIAANIFEKAVRIRRRIYNLNSQSINQTAGGTCKNVTNILTILARSVYNWAECVYLIDKEKGEALHREAYSLRLSVLQNDSLINPSSGQTHSNRISLQDVAESEVRLARICTETNKPSQGISLATMAQKKIIEALEIIKEQKIQIFGAVDRETEISTGSVHIFEISKLKTLLRAAESILKLSNKGKSYINTTQNMNQNLNDSMKNIVLSEESAPGSNWMGGLVV